MAFDPAGYLPLANQLDTTGANEASVRTSAGRAYYCAFLTARERLKKLGFVRPPSSALPSHVWYIRCLRDSPQLRSLGERLHGLKKLREDADYELGKPHPQGAGLTVAKRAKAWIDDFVKVKDADLQQYVRRPQ